MSGEFGFVRESCVPKKFMDCGLMTVVGALVLVGGLGSIFIGIGGLVMKYALNFIVSRMGGPPPATLVMGRQEELLMWVNLALYVPTGVGLVLLGLGTIRCRRWARSLMESLSALMTLVGVVGLFVSLLFLFLAPDFFQVILKESFSSLADERMIATVAFFIWLGIVVGAFFYIGIPAALWCFYRLPSVRALCEHRDPQGSWLDRNPPLVNALVMVNGAGIFLALPFYVLEAGTGLTGFALPLALTGICLALLAAGVGLAKMKLWGWMLEFVLALGLSIAGSWWVATASTRGLVEWYFGVVGMNSMPEFEAGIYVIFDIVAHFVIWGSSLPVIYVLCREAGGFFSNKAATPLSAA